MSPFSSTRGSGMTATSEAEMAYKAKFFGGPTHGRVYNVADDAQHIDVESWVNPIMPYEECEKLESHTKKTRYLRHFTVVNQDGTPLIGYFFPEDANEEFINGIMNMEFADITPKIKRTEKSNDQ